MRSVIVSWLCFSIAGCGGNDALAQAGALTGPCLDAACFDGLACISDVCVDPSDADTSGRDEGGSVGGTTGSSTDADSGMDTGLSGPTTGPPSSSGDAGTDTGRLDAADGTNDDHGDTTTTSSTTGATTDTSDDGSTTTGSEACTVMPNDLPCFECVKTQCCGPFEACLADGNANSGCFCVQACVAQGTDWTVCLNDCGLAMPPGDSPVVSLGACIYTECAVCL